MESKQKGKLTIFLGYDDYLLDRMLTQAYQDYQNGIHVFIGCSKSEVKLFESIQPHIDRSIHFKHIYENNPDVVVIDCISSLQQYENIQQLLNHGYDVYTTLNMTQLLEGQIHLIEDYIFDQTDNIVFVDVSKDHPLRQQTLKKYLHWLENQIQNKEITNHTSEHILVCISASPSNIAVIQAAAKMATAFHAKLTALYISPIGKHNLKEAARKQLEKNMDLAKCLGAKIETIYGDDIAFQIGEYARLSSVTKIVIGRSVEKRKFFVKKTLLSEQLLSLSPQFDLYIIPVQEQPAYYVKKERQSFNKTDLYISLLVLAICTLVGYLFFLLGFNDANIIMIYILGVLIIAISTSARIYSILSSFISVIIFNFCFTFPVLSLSAYESGYPITFLIMFIVAFVTSSLAVKIQKNAKISSYMAYRTKVLLETNQMLQKETTQEGIIHSGCQQLLKLLNRDIVFYPVHNEDLQQPFIFPYGDNTHIEECIRSQETIVARWVLVHNKHAGASTHYLSAARCLYLAVRVNDKVYGVVGIYLNKERLDSFANDVLLAILGEMAFALENEKTIKDKNETDIKAKNEQLRANLLRSISHDLRTPLTSISGNAGILLSNEEALSHDDKTKLYSDIYDDSLWLINLVENLLSVTRIEQGSMQLNMSPQLVEEVVYEALKHVSRKKIEHHIDVEIDDEFLMGNMDARLIIQVIINIVDNAIKYTPAGSHITIHSYQEENMIVIDIYDDGPGIGDDKKDKIFDMFYSANERIVDSKRSLGLGLALCKSIVNAHGGKIQILDNYPQGALFRFTLPAQEVNIDINTIQ